MDHSTIPAGRKTARVRGWRIAELRALARERKLFTARQLMQRCEGMDMLHAQALLASYCRKGEIVCRRKGIGGSDSVEALYQRA